MLSMSRAVRVEISDAWKGPQQGLASGLLHRAFTADCALGRRRGRWSWARLLRDECLFLQLDPLPFCLCPRAAGHR